MKTEYEQKEQYYELFIKASLFKILAILNRHFSDERRKSTSGSNSSNNVVNSIISYIKFNFKEDITLDDLSSRFNLNKSYLATLLKKSTDMTVFQYIKDTRLWYANYLITNSSMTITEIALSSGFKNVSNFAKCYKEKYNITPTENRKVRQ